MSLRCCLPSLSMPPSLVAVVARVALVAQYNIDLLMTVGLAHHLYCFTSFYICIMHV